MAGSDDAVRLELDEMELGLFCGEGLIFSVALLCDEKIIVFIIKYGNWLVLRSPGLVCGENPGVCNAQLSLPGA